MWFPELSINDLRIGDNNRNPLTYQPVNPPRPGHCRELGPSEANLWSRKHDRFGPQNVAEISGNPFISGKSRLVIVARESQSRPRLVKDYNLTRSTDLDDMPLLNMLNLLKNLHQNYMKQIRPSPNLMDESKVQNNSLSNNKQHFIFQHRGNK